MLLLLMDIGSEQAGVTVVYEDTQGAMALAKNAGYQARTKHIDIRYHFIRENVASGEIELEYVDTKIQLAEYLTKCLPAKTRCYLLGRSFVGIELEISNWVGVLLLYFAVNSSGYISLDTRHARTIMRATAEVTGIVGPDWQMIVYPEL